MNTVRFPLLRGSLLLIALAAIAFILARGDNPAQATSYNPAFSVSVSDSNPGAAADLKIDFSVDKPDSFPNVRTNSSIQFLPRQWGVHVPETEEEMAARVGGYAGTFDALTTLGIFGTGTCALRIPVPFRMMEASPYTGYDAATGTYDPQKLTSSLEIDELAGHPGGVGYTGQFVGDPLTIQPPGDLGLPLRGFNDDEMHTTAGGFPGPYQANQWAYRNMDGLSSGGYPRVSVGDIRLTVYGSELGTGGGDPFFIKYYPAGSVVQPGDDDLWAGDTGNRLYNFATVYKHDNADGNLQMDPGENIYKDLTADESGNYGTVSYGDSRMFIYGQPLTSTPRENAVEDFYLPGGVSRYPDFLNQMIPPAVVGDPLARQVGVTNVLDQTAASVNIVTYRPGQLPGYPASLGYPNVVVVLNPVAPIDVVSINTTSELCTPLSLTSTNLGVSKDNPTTAANEGGYVRLTNPKAEKSHEFTLITTSQPDADDDGIENMLDTCPLTPNTEDDGHAGGVNRGWGQDSDSLDGSCDPDPAQRGSAGWQSWDEDQDTYGNRADNCSTAPNGVELLGIGYVASAYFTLYYGITGDLIGPNNQADTDGDDIGDACEGAESGGAGANLANQQCVGADDDDGDGYVNDGCPANTAFEESGAQCDNAVDDDGDGYVNDGCPTVPNAETGDQCLNDADDDGDGLVNDGCPSGGARPETKYASTMRLFLKPDNVVVSSNYSDYYSAPKAFDGTTGTSWCTSTTDKTPGNYIEAQFNSPQDISTLDIHSQWYGESFKTGTITMSNGFSQDISLNATGWTSFTFPAQAGVTWVRFTGLTQNGGSDSCFSEFELNYTGTVTTGQECNNATDDDGDGLVNDGCPTFPAQPAEMGFRCNNALDDDFDGKVNDGCPAFYAPGAPEGQCSNNANDDSSDDSYVNDGCPAVGEAETGDQCGNTVDDDGDGYVNDGCPVIGSIAETDQCDNATDDDGDGLVNDGCPAVDPGDYAKTHITGHMHVVTLTQGVRIARHGIKLEDLDGPERVALDGSGSYRVALENKSGSAEEIQVALRVVEGCGNVTGPSSVHANEDASVKADFTVDFSGCTAGEYTVQADACHAGDPAPNGFFGAGACPGASDVPPVPAQLSPSGATASSEAFGPDYSAAKAIDNNSDTLWCTMFEPGVNIQASFASPVSIGGQVDIENSFAFEGYSFVSGTLTFSNGYSQDVTLTNGAGSFSVPLQSGVEWVKFTGTAGAWAACISELKISGLVPAVGDTNLLDDAPRSVTVVVAP